MICLPNAFVQCKTMSGAPHKWFDLQLQPATEDEVRFVQVDRTSAACCGCCGCFLNCCRQRDRDRWRDFDGRLRRSSLMDTGAVVGGALFAVAVAAMLVLVLLVWSLDSFGDDSFGASVGGESSSGVLSLESSSGVVSSVSISDVGSGF